MSQYPPKDFERNPACRALIASVESDSPAYDAGFAPGCYITAVDGQPVRDVIDWRWLTSDDAIEVSYIDLDGDAGEVELWREPGQDWGFGFEGLVFDEVKQCRNACTFCFMRQLPPGMRPSLSLRDDDFRLSFLVGTFVTCTNLTSEDEARIIEQRISPLRVSLQATDAEARRRLIGKHAQHGLDALDRLLAAGIEFHAQVVLVPDENDGDVLAETLAWAYDRPGILGIGIVPLGYTRHQTMFDHSFNDKDASRGLLGIVEPFQQRALAERGTPWVYAADEFYRNAYPEDLLDHLPPADFYGDFAMFEDGIGIVRSTVDDWERAEGESVIAACADALRQANVVARMVVGCAQREFLQPLIERSGIVDIFQPLYVPNSFFGGNVDVTGLLVAEDITAAVKQAVKSLEEISEAARKWRQSGSEDCLSPRSGRVPQLLCRNDEREPQLVPKEDSRSVYLIPRVVFNDDGITLDGRTLEDMEEAAGQTLHMVSCTPAEYFNEIIAIIA